MHNNETQWKNGLIKKIDVCKKMIINLYVFINKLRGRNHEIDLAIDVNQVFCPRKYCIVKLAPNC